MASQPKKSKSSESRVFRQAWLQDFEWLRFDSAKGLMFCEVCRSADLTLPGTTDFTTGSDKFKRENLKSHSVSRRHQKCRDYVLNKQNPCQFSQTVIGKQFMSAEQKSNEKTIAELKIKFNTAYCIGKEELAYTKFRSLLLLQKKNGLDIHPGYANDVRCGEMLSTIASTLRDDTRQTLSETKYIAVLIDGATDTSVSENEVVFVRHVENGVPKNKLLDMKSLQHAHAEGVVSAIQSSLIAAGLDESTWKTKIVAFCADGASVNLGQRNGVVALLRNVIPHLIDIHCMAHRLELALLQVQKHCPFVQSVSDCLHLIWKTYHYSPKSRRELMEIGKELDTRIYSPAPVAGTRWVPHIDRALKTFLQGKRDGSLVQDSGHYAAVYIHMESLASSSKNADIKGRATKIVKEMSSSDFVGFCHFMADLFTEIGNLSLKLQSRSLILPTAVSAIHECIESISSMTNQPIPGGMYEKIKNCLANQSEKGDAVLFQGIQLKIKGEETFSEKLSTAVNQTVHMTCDELRSRFHNMLGANKDDRAQETIHSMTIFHHDTWPSDIKELLVYGSDELKVLCDWFKGPLEAASCDLNAVPMEWRQLKVLVSNSFKDKSYADLWQVLLTKDPYKSDFKNILNLVEIMMVLPISTAECERSFSAQRRIKCDTRSSLSVERLADMILISSEGPELDEYDPSSAVNKWMSTGKRKLSSCPGQKDWREDIVQVNPVPSTSF